ncbi:MAG: hypothetical protein ACR2NR_05780 [Solirubrobacteraceae bacterium]
MSFPSRQLAVAGVAILALGAGAGPVLASGSSSSSAVKAKTPLVAKIETRSSELDYSNPGCDFFTSSSCEVDRALEPQERAIRFLVRPVEAVHAGSAQLPAKLEWVLGADLEAWGGGSLRWGEQNLIYRRNTQAQKRLIHAGLLDFRLANYYIANADSQLGVPHRALEVEPNRLVGKDVTSAEKKPLIADLSTGSLVATTDSAAAVIDEHVPSRFASVSYTINEAAAAYHAVSVARLHVSSGQRSAQTKWVEGAHLLQQGDTQLAHAAAASLVPLTATIRHDVASAFTTLRRANSEIRQADEQLGIHHPEPTVTLPTTISGFRGVIGYPGVS